MTIGLLLPQSSLYTTLPFDIVEGLRAGLAEVGMTDARLAMESIEHGTNPNDVLAKAQKLLLQEGADVVIGMMSRRVADALAPTFEAANRLLLVLDVVGEFFAGQMPSPNVYFHSLQSCVGTWLAGREAAQLGRVIQASSYYEAGYLLGYATSQGVAAAGGEMGGWAVTPLKTAEFTLAQLQAHLEHRTGEAILACYAADMAALFFQQYADVPNPDNVPMWGGPLLLDEQTLARTPHVPAGLRGYVTWSETLGNVPNHRFQEALRQRGRHPNLFSLLAYEAATYLNTPLHQLNILSFDSPRGTITMNATTHYSTGPMYPATVVTAEDGTARLSVGTPVSTTEAIDHLLAQGQLPTYANWFNTYLCI
jgi:branched-chain amino acid transport system substrate-binding protein